MKTLLLAQIDASLAAVVPNKDHTEYAAAYEYFISGAYARVEYATAAKAALASQQLKDSLKRWRERIGYVTFKTRTGTFKVLNTKEHLERFAARVAAPNSGFGKYTPPRGQRTPKATPEQAERFVTSTLKNPKATPEDVANAIEMACLHRIEEKFAESLV